MIEYRLKCFSEYEAMISLYNKMMSDQRWRNRIKVIEKGALASILRGNNVVIERFVISTSFFGKDRYRMYLKLGAKVKLPESFKLPGYNKYQHSKLENTLETTITGGLKLNNNNNNNGNGQNQNQNKGEYQKQWSDTMVFEQKEFGKNKGGNGGDNGGGGPISFKFKPKLNLGHEVTVSKGDTLSYDKKERSVVLEFDSIEDAISSLNYLPLGLSYNIYLLNVC